MPQANKHLGQKIALFFAVLSYLGAVGCIAAVWMLEFDADQDPIKASLMASVVFFIGCGTVLHVIATAKLKGLLSGGGDIQQP